MNRKQYEEAGKLLIDLGKYLITAVFFGQFFSESINISFALLLAAPTLAIFLIYVGLRLLGANKDTNGRTANSHRNNSIKPRRNKQIKKTINLL